MTIEKKTRISAFALSMFLCFFTTTLCQPAPGKHPPALNIDFSCAGYKGGQALPPSVPAVMLVRPSGGDDTRLLQAAIDALGKLPVQSNGFHGALLLGEGIFRVSGKLRITTSGIVLRGSSGKRATTILATGTDRRTLLEIGDPGEVLPAGAPVQVVDTYVPAGGTVLTLSSTTGIKTGDHLVITRPSPANWIADLGMNKAEGMFVDRRGLQWPAGSRDLVWDRRVTRLDTSARQVTLDAPVTTPLEQLYGGGTVQVLTTPMLEEIGLENLVLESAEDPANPAGEEHAWSSIAINSVEHVWIRSVTARHFTGSAVSVGHRARCITIQDCRSEQPRSEVAGYRRRSFLVEGQQVLVYRCQADSGLNDFAAGFCAGGPNVFLACKATHALGASGAVESWTSGVLYENDTIQGAGLRLTYDFTRSQGGGWTAANSVVWNSVATGGIEAQAPAEYANLVGSDQVSLYEQQAAGSVRNAPLKAPATSIQKSTGKIYPFTGKDVPPAAPAVAKALHPLQLEQGRFVIDGKVVWGGQTGDQYWRGQPFAGGELNSGFSITRFVPGKSGPGLTEDLPALAQTLAQQGIVFYQGVTGLWYDRRRDDHSTKKRPDSQVWAPFYEMPWARSGKGTAWDGMSRYDLTKYNPWYFSRAREFAQLCDENGLVCYHNLYDTHNLLEYVTHWVDHPWRPVNNVNNTPLPEPLPVEPWARLHLGNQFYSTDAETMRKLHHAYIFHVLDELGTSRNTIFNLGIQYSGPLSFQRFFLQTIGEWEQQHGQNVRVAITASKDVTDAVLADPTLAALVDVIDTRYWQYRPDGLFSNGDSLWAPPGGVNRSYREMVGEAFLQETDYPLPTTQELMYRQVREYTDRFPGKAVVSVYNEVSPVASLMAGGAQVTMGAVKSRGPGHLSLTDFIRQYLSQVLMNMKPADGLLADSARNWCMTDAGKDHVLLYSLSGTGIGISSDFPEHRYTGTWFDPQSEKVVPLTQEVTLRKGTMISKPNGNNWLLLLQAR